MKVVNRRGERVPVRLERIQDRIAAVSEDLNVDPALVAQRTIPALHDGISTSELDTVSADKAEGLKLTTHIDYGVLATRLLITNLHKNTPDSFSLCMNKLNAAEPKRMNQEFVRFIAENAEWLDSVVVHDRDFDFDYVAATKLLRTYLQSSNSVVIDRPQYMYLRVAIQVCHGMCKDTRATIERIYHRLSKHEYTHATPTLMHSCMTTNQLASCFLLGTGDDQMDILKTMKDAAVISKKGGGVGFHVSNIRSQGQKIHSSGGQAAGLPLQLRVYNAHARLWDQGGNKRPAGLAAYVEITHPDILRFLELRLPQGAELERAHDLNIACWIPDLFMRRLQSDARISLFSEDTAPHLSSVHDGMMVCDVCNYCPNPDYALVGGPVREKCASCNYKSVDVYTQLYEKYEREGRAVHVVSAKDIVRAISISQEKTGQPYICFKDHVNCQSNQQNIGTIKSSNLCTEIMQHSDKNSYSVCTLASINLSHFVNGSTYDFAALMETVRDIASVLDNMVSIANYPVKRCNDHSRRYRPIGIGVQGLANVFAMLDMPFCSPEAQQLDMQIFEHIYYAALSGSVDLAAQRGPYESWQSSPAGRGILRFDLYGRGGFAPQDMSYTRTLPWDKLKERISAHGLRCSLHIALMPTASTSQLLGNNESFEPFRALIHTNQGVSGRLTVANPVMHRQLTDAGLWNNDVYNYVLSTGKLPDSIPAKYHERYMSVWEMSQKYLQNRAALRSMFIDQAQSLNLYVPNVSLATQATLMMNAWKAGLMTGSYYIHSKPAAEPRKTVTVKSEPDGEVCLPGCESCSA